MGYFNFFHVHSNHYAIMEVELFGYGYELSGSFWSRKKGLHSLEELSKLPVWWLKTLCCLRTGECGRNSWRDGTLLFAHQEWTTKKGTLSKSIAQQSWFLVFDLVKSGLYFAGLTIRKCLFTAINAIVWTEVNAKVDDKRPWNRHVASPKGHFETIPE